jgi:hypothetical protein
MAAMNLLRGLNGSIALADPLGSRFDLAVLDKDSLFYFGNILN